MANRIAITDLVLMLALVPGQVFAQTAPGQAVRPTRASLQQPVQTHLISTLAGREIPPVAPQVTCAGGRVTLDAPNSTLASVLRAVASCTGAVVDMPASIGTTRVAARLGPEQPTTVLAALLDGSLDYIILGSTRNPGQVRRVIVRPRQATTAGINQQSAASRLSQPEPVAQAVAATFIDGEGVERLPSGLTKEEALLSPEDLARKFQAAREQQRQMDGLPPMPDPSQP